jgi:hypothetical protein
MLGTLVDRFLGRLVTRSFRRGMAGEPVFLVLGAAAWLVVRSRRKDRPVVWSGTLEEGDKIVLSNFGREVNFGRDVPGTSPPG